jgi:sulfite exporter TauE/SafE
MDTDSRGLKIFASLILGLLLIFFGLVQLNFFPQRKRFGFFLFKFQNKIMMKNKLLIDKFPVLLGLLTGLFPCGWLYSFVILASQMTTLTESVLVIFIFWLTSLPAFLVFTGFIAQLIRKSPVSYQRISAIVLIAAGLFSILGHWAEYLKP